MSTRHSTLRRLIAALLLSATLTTTIACGQTIGAPGSVVVTPEQQEQAKLERIQKIAVIFGRVGVAVQTVQTIEIVIASAPNSPISPATHRQFQSAVLSWANSILSIRSTIENVTRSTMSDRLDVIQVALDATDRFLAELPAGIPDSLNLQVRSAVATVQALIPVLALIS